MKHILNTLNSTLILVHTWNKIPKDKMCRAISLQRLNFLFDVSVTLNLFYNQDTTGIYFGVLNNRYTF